MNKDTLAKRLTLVCLCVGILASVPLLSGCGNGAAGGHEMTKDDFKNKTPPPEALRGMQEAQKRAGTQANAQTPLRAPHPSDREIIRPFLKKAREWHLPFARLLP